MSDLLLTIRVPEELVAQAKVAHVEIESFLIDSLARKLGVPAAAPRVELPPPANRMPTREEVEAEIQKSMERVASGKYPLRTLGLNKGTAWVSDDFDDPLPDEFWLGEDDDS